MEFSWIGNKYNFLNKLINVEVHDYIWGFGGFRGFRALFLFSFTKSFFWV